MLSGAAGARGNRVDVLDARAADAVFKATGTVDASTSTAAFRPDRSAVTSCGSLSDAAATARVNPLLHAPGAWQSRRSARWTSWPRRRQGVRRESAAALIGLGGAPAGGEARKLIVIDGRVALMGGL